MATKITFVFAVVFILAIPFLWLWPGISTEIAIAYTAAFILTVIGYVISVVVDRILRSIFKRQ